MRICWVGGLTRSEVHPTRMATKAGHELEYHNGDVKGHRADKLLNLFDRSALVIILTTVNSHNDVQLAKRVARKHNRPTIVMPRCSQFAFRELLSAFDGGNDRRKNQSIVTSGREETGFQGHCKCLTGRFNSSSGRQFI
jgi:hypothetical protein